MIYWELVKRFWWAIPLIGAALWVSVLIGERDHYRAEDARHVAQLHRAAELYDAEKAKVDATDARWKSTIGEYANAANQKLADIDADRSSLAGRLRVAPGLCPGGVSDPAAGRPGDDGASGESGGEGAAAALDSYDAACRRDAAKLDYFQSRAAALASGSDPPAPPAPSAQP